MIHHGPREIAAGGVRLREVTPADAADLYRWRMHPSTRPMFRSTGSVPFAAHEAFLARYFTADNTDAWFVVEAGGEPVGTISLYDRSGDGSTAEWGRFTIGPEHRRNGWGRRALELLMDYARAVGVRRLACEVLAGNTAADGLYRRLGFVETGSEDTEGRRFVALAADLTVTGKD